MKRRFFVCVCTSLAAGAFAYTNDFTLDFNTASTAGWADPAANGSTFFSGETAGVDSPPHSPTPEAAAGANGNGWFRMYSAQANGIALGIYDGTAGGSTTDPTNYTIEADMFVALPATNRYQAGLVARYLSGQGNFPFEFFYSQNTPGQPNGYGFRNTGGGSATSYGIFSGITESPNRWVRLKISVDGNQAEVSVDRDKNGTYDNTQTGITLGNATTARDVSGKPGVFHVINDGLNLIPNQYTYFDNFAYTKIIPPNAAQDWALFE